MENIIETSQNQTAKDSLPQVSVVVIGRNEARNLPACIRSIQAMGYPQEKLEILYVDTDSIDGSPEVARSLGVLVIEENSNFPSPARGRNRGWREARYEVVHFVDGDVTVSPGYLRSAVECLGVNGVCCVIGRLHERYAETYWIASILEYPWRLKKPGYVDAPGAGGTFLRSALQDVNGYDDEVLRGEETELGYRLRQKGFRILMIDQPMGIHDYEIYNLFDLWRFYEMKGGSLARMLRLPPSEPITAEQRVGRRVLVQMGLAGIVSIALIISGWWLGLLLLPLVLVFYVAARYWNPPHLRNLRLPYFMFEYFFKPAIWIGMIRFVLIRP